MAWTTQDRQHWFSVLARSHADLVLERSEPWIVPDDFRVVKPPEVGMLQVQGRTGGKGQAFNIGDITITRCTVCGPDNFYGHAVLSGRRKDYALRVAQLDALLQHPAYHTDCMHNIIMPMHNRWQEAQAQKQARVAQTRVDFFTLVRGEDS